jgi:hypothetical protein
MYTYMYIYIHVYMYICIYVYMYTFTYMYTHTLARQRGAHLHARACVHVCARFDQCCRRPASLSLSLSVSVSVSLGSNSNNTVRTRACTARTRKHARKTLAHVPPLSLPLRPSPNTPLPYHTLSLPVSTVAVTVPSDRRLHEAMWLQALLVAREREWREGRARGGEAGAVPPCNLVEVFRD